MDEPTPDFDDNSALATESELDPEDDDLPDADPITPAPTAVESLVSGRARRSNAGNRLATLLHQEADAEDTLFMEDEDDVEFRVRDRREDLDDLLLDSSSEDEEDAGADGKGGDEDFEGEKELQRAEKEAKRAKKRKADEAFMKPRRAPPTKRVTIKEKDTGTTTATTSAADSPAATDEALSALTRPRKKSERVSWVPEFTAVRSSTRTLALQNRSETMRRLEESEKRRLHTIRLMEKAAAKKEKSHPKREMTQEERLAEAKITEARNLKSLNRWEQMENARLEEQRKKLAALQNRRLVGPVITYWSGRAEYNANGKLVKLGKGLIEELEEDSIEVSKNKKKARKGKDKNDEEKKDEVEKKETIRTYTPETGQPASQVPSRSSNERTFGPAITACVRCRSRKTRCDHLLPCTACSKAGVECIQAAPRASGKKEPTRKSTPQIDESENSSQKASQSVSRSSIEKAPIPTITTSKPSDSKTVASPVPAPTPAPAPTLASAPAPAAVPAPVSAPVSAQPEPSTPLVQPPVPSPVGKEPLPSFLEGIYDYAALPDPAAKKTDQVTPADTQPIIQEPVAQQEPEEPPVHGPQLPPEYATRNLIVLENFDPEVVRTRDGIIKALCSIHKRQLPIPKPLCVITHQPARFRDPSTGMPYASLHAYNEIRRILRGEMQWSSLLGAYIGVPGVAAAGVPEGFLV